MRYDWEVGHGWVRVSDVWGLSLVPAVYEGFKRVGALYICLQHSLYQWLVIRISQRQQY